MARISKYPVQPNPDGSDILLGTDINGGAYATKNFFVKDIGAASIADFLENTNWKFEKDILVAPFEKNTVYRPLGGGDEFSWSSVTALRFQTIMKNDTNSLKYLSYLLSSDPVTGLPSVNNKIKIYDRNSLDSFGIFTFTALTLIEGSIYEATLSHISSTGGTQQGKIYGAEFAQEEEDKEFIFNQPTPQVTWTINHNLNKFPSVSVVNTNNILMYGDTTYVDKDNLIITFSAGFSGKAYLN
jgi:hypothetical protein